MRLPLLFRAARRLAAARPEARRFAARAWLAAPLVRGSLAAAGLQPTLRWIESASAQRGARPPVRPVGVDEGRALVQGAFRFHLVGGECLHQSLVQYLLHRRDGVAARLVVGVKRAGHDGGPSEGPPNPPGGPGIAAHAWVEGGDAKAPVGPDDPTFVPLFVSGADAMVAAVPGTWSVT